MFRCLLAVLLLRLSEVGAAHALPRDGLAAQFLPHPDAAQIENGEAQQRFGEHPPDSDGQRLIVGVSTAVEEAAYVYRQADGQWLLEARLDKPAGSRVGFGQSVAISGEHAAVGGGLDEVYTYRFSDGVWSLDPTPLVFSGCDGSCGAEGAGILSLAGTRLLVGTPGLNLRGAVHVFERGDGNYGQVLRLVDRDTVAGDRFGRSLDQHGAQAIIGARGAAMVYRLNGAQAEREARFAGQVADDFGVQVRIHGGLALVGAPLADGAFTDQGRLLVFQRDGGGDWAQLQQFAGAAALARVGEAADVASELIAVRRNQPARVEVHTRPAGSSGTFTLLAGVDRSARQLRWIDRDLMISQPGADIGRNGDQGLLEQLALRGSNLLPTQTIFLADGPDGDAFGTAVARTGSVGWIGAPEADFGAGRVFRLGLQTPAPSVLRILAPAGGGRYGAGIGVSATVLAVGAPDSVVAGIASGAVYVHDVQSQVLLQTLVPADAAPGLEFGRSVALNGDHLLVGAVESAYWFQRQGAVWVEIQRFQDSTVRGLGEAVALSAFDGVLSAARTELGLPEVGICLVFALDAPGATPLRLQPGLPDRFPGGRYCQRVATFGTSASDRLLAAAQAFRGDIQPLRDRAEVWRHNLSVSQPFVRAGDLVNAPLRSEPVALGVALSAEHALYASAGGVVQARRSGDGYVDPVFRAVTPAPDPSFASALVLDGAAALAGAPLATADNGRRTGAAWAFTLDATPPADALFADDFE